MKRSRPLGKGGAAIMRGIRAQNAELRDKAVALALTRNDDYNATRYRGMKPANLSVAELDDLCLYLGLV
jgi:hypothetical protein